MGSWPLILVTAFENHPFVLQLPATDESRNTCLRPAASTSLEADVESVSCAPALAFGSSTRATGQPGGSG